MRHHIPQRMMEDALAQRNRISPPRSGKARAALSLMHPNAAGVDIGPMLAFTKLTTPTQGGNFTGTLAWQTTAGQAADVQQVKAYIAQNCK